MFCTLLYCWTFCTGLRVGIGLILDFGADYFVVFESFGRSVWQPCDYAKQNRTFPENERFKHLHFRKQLKTYSKLETFADTTLALYCHVRLRRTILPKVLRRLPLHTRDPHAQYCSVTLWSTTPWLSWCCSQLRSLHDTTNS